MRPPQIRAFLDDEIVVDLFAGGGGASCGIEAALGRHVTIAINHDPIAMAVHQKNHPRTKHFVSNVWEVDPRIACAGQRVGLLWASPDCTHHSRAKGSKPLSSKRRALASVVIRWARTVRPRVIVMENVAEFADWGPLDAKGRPDKSKAGRSFECWLGKLQAAGAKWGQRYVVEYRMLVAADFGTPTTRKRLFLIARCDGEPIVWPEPSHGKGRALPWRAAAEVIDFSDVGASIFERKKPLADATMRRIAAGIERYVVNAQPFIFPLTHHGGPRVHGVEDPVVTVTAAHRGELAICSPVIVKYHGGAEPHQSERVAPCDEPLRTVDTQPRFALATPLLIQTGYGEREGQAPRALDIQAPLGVVVACGAKHALAVPVIVPHYGGANGNPTAPRSVTAPAPAVTARDHTSLATAFMVKWFGTTKAGSPVTAPMPTVLSGGGRGGGHAGLVHAFLVKYYSGKRGRPQTSKLSDPLPTVVTKERFGLVTIGGEDWQIVNVFLRMLKPTELKKAQGFEEAYDLEPARTKTKQIALIGNSVCQQVAEAIVRANAPAPVGQLGLFQGAA